MKAKTKTANRRQARKHHKRKPHKPNPPRIRVHHISVPVPVPEKGKRDPMTKPTITAIQEDDKFGLRITGYHPESAGGEDISSEHKGIRFEILPPESDEWTKAGDVIYPKKTIDVFPTEKGSYAFRTRGLLPALLLHGGDNPNYIKVGPPSDEETCTFDPYLPDKCKKPSISDIYPDNPNA